jgi:TorA maturation chaperone TorD
MQEILADALPRASVYRLLARLFAEEVDAEFFEHLTAGELRSVCPQLANALPTGQAAEACEELAIEFCRVFVGPNGHLPPVQSIWCNGQLNSEVVARLDTYQAIIGLPPPWKQKLVTDHLANSLDLMSVLLRRASEPGNQAITAPETAALADLAASLLVDHLQWADVLLRRVIEHPGASFYGVVSTMTQEFLCDEALRLPRDTSRELDIKEAT